MNEESKLEDNQDIEPQDTQDETSTPSVEAPKTVDDLITPQKRKEISAEKIAKSEAMKFLTGEKSEEDIPAWVREDALRVARQVSGNLTNDDKLIEMEKKFQQQIDDLKAEKLKIEQDNDNQKTKAIVGTFLKNYDLTPKEFDETYGKYYFKELERLTKMGHSQSEATKFALADIRFKMDSEDRDLSAMATGFSIPVGGVETPKKTNQRLTPRQVELAKRFGNDPTKVY